MERDLSVNADLTSAGKTESPGGLVADPEQASANEAGTPQANGPFRRELKDQRPCLYLGPAGQRCTRPALEDGFCALHQPGALGSKSAFGRSSRLMAALLAILGMLWPFLSDIVREVIRWIHTR